MNTPITIPIPAVEGDAGVPLVYDGATSDPTNLQFAASGTGPSDGSVTLSPSGNIVGLYEFVVGVRRNSTDSNSNTSFDSQYLPLFIRPAAPASLSVWNPQRRTRSVVSQLMQASVMETP